MLQYLLTTHVMFTVMAYNHIPATSLLSSTRVMVTKQMFVRLYIVINIQQGGNILPCIHVYTPKHIMQKHAYRLFYITKSKPLPISKPSPKRKSKSRLRPKPIPKPNHHLNQTFSSLIQYNLIYSQADITHLTSISLILLKF